jgi:DNA-binding CsgD family transcriptional regulator
MVGRNAELTSLRAGLQETRVGPRVVLVSGEAGVGKTRLLVELADALSADTTFLGAQAEPTAMGRPFQLLQDAVGPEIESWHVVPAALEPMEDAVRVLLGPAGRGLSSTLQSDANGDGRAYGSDELLAAAIQLLRHLLANRRGIVVFEDLHWADPDSLAAFIRLASSDLDVLMIGTYRPEALDRRHVTDVLAALERQCRVEHVSLARLTIDQVAELLAAVRGESVGLEVAAAVHRRTAGNPFFIEELLLAAGDAPVEVVSHLPLPVTLTEAVVRRLDGLDTSQRRVIDAASVLPQHIPFDLLCTLTGVSEDDMVDALRVLVGNGLLVEDAPDIFSFRHALTREAVRGRLLGRERRRLHETAFTALAASGSEDWAALAHHAAGAGRPDDVVDAARRGAHHYLHTGATHQALRLAELGVAEADADLQLLELATRAAWAVGLLATALERAEKWRRMAETTDSPVDLCRALRVLARLRWEAHDPDAHAEAVRTAREVAELLPVGEERAWVVNLVAEASYLSGRCSEALGLTDEALAVAGPHPSAELQAAVLVNRGSSMLEVGDQRELGAALLRQGIDDAAAVGDHLSALRGLNNLLSFAMSSWETGPCLELVSRMDELIAMSGRRDWAGAQRTRRAGVLAWVVGDLAGARAELDLPINELRETKWAALMAAELAIESSDFEAADRLLHATAEWTEGDAHHAALRLFRAAVGDGSRNMAAAADEVASRLSEASVHLIHDSANLSANALSEALRHGMPADAARTALDALSVWDAEENDHRVDSGWVLHLGAALAESEGDATAALEGYRAASQPGPAHRSPAALASAHLGMARLLLAADPPDPEEAQREGEIALTLLEHWPGWRRDDAVALLGRLRPRGRPKPSGVLTDREREVADLVADGLTNGDIAKRLYVSPKTASVHVSNILRKLGMSSRAEVAAWVARSGR